LVGRRLPPAPRCQHATLCMQQHVTHGGVCCAGCAVPWLQKGIVGLAYTMSQILEKEVYLVETIDATHEPMMHLKALCFLRPTEANMRMLKAELANPKYSEYHIFFSNVVVEEKLRQLAEADERSVVKQVQEFYADFYAVNSDLFTLNLGQTCVLWWLW